MGRRGFRSAFLSTVEIAETETGCRLQPLSPRLPILAVICWVNLKLIALIIFFITPKSSKMEEKRIIINN